MILDERIMRLIAVGASVSANCGPCLETNVNKAKENGASEVEIAEAIWVGTLVRRGAASKMDELASKLNRKLPSSKQLTKDVCECETHVRK